MQRFKMQPELSKISVSLYPMQHYIIDDIGEPRTALLPAESLPLTTLREETPPKLRYSN